MTKRLGLRAKLTLSYLLVGIAVTVLNLYATDRTEQAAARVRNARTESLQHAQQLLSVANSAFEESFAYVLSGEPAEKESCLGKMLMLAVQHKALMQRPDLGAEELAQATTADLHIHDVLEHTRELFREYETRGSVRPEMFVAYERSIDALSESAKELLRVIAAKAANDDRMTRRATTLTIFKIGSVAVFATGLLGMLFGRSVTKPLQSLGAAATAFGKGDFAYPVEVESGDEIGDLARTFRGMSADIRGLLSKVERHKGELEDLVARRTRELELLVAQRTHELAAEKLVLESTGDGLAMVDRAGGFSGQLSQALVRWFGEPAPGMRLWDYLGSDGRASQEFAAAFAQLVEEYLPFELSAHQMPRHLQRGGRHYELTYRQVIEDREFSRVLLVVHDVTTHVEAERAERAAKEEYDIARQLLRDKKGFLQCIDDCTQLVAGITERRSTHDAKFKLHTLKGCAAAYGFRSVAERCHDLETRMEVTGEPPTTHEVEQLRDLWLAHLKPFQELIANDARDVIEITVSDWSQVVEALNEQRDPIEILALVERWRWDPTVEYLSRMAAQVERLAEKLGKRVRVEVEHNSIRLAPGWLDGFWPSVTHVLRNAVDHGIEDPETRVAQGKPAAGTVRVATRIEGDALVVEVSDDGRGIDFDAVSKAAEKRGMAVASASELVDALFVEGLTTRDAVTEQSGRGVGLGAARESCEHAGGRVVVRTELGKGTRFEFRFSYPRDASTGSPLVRSFVTHASGHLARTEDRALRASEPPRAIA
jgi:two-component system chemotaxis sensor kinase CheA